MKNGQPFEWPDSLSVAFDVLWSTAELWVLRQSCPCNNKGSCFFFFFFFFTQNHNTQFSTIGHRWLHLHKIELAASLGYTILPTEVRDQISFYEHFGCWRNIAPAQREKHSLKLSLSYKSKKDRFISCKSNGCPLQAHLISVQFQMKKMKKNHPQSSLYFWSYQEVNFTNNIKWTK